MFKLISLFSGIGGIDLAFERAGFEVVCQVENNPYCQKVLQKHWPNVLRLGDICNVKGTDLPTADVMAGGFPCQDISTAGKGAGIKEGNRSGLWFEFARLIGEFRPAIVFLENVPAITTNGGTTVLESLAALRYDAEWGIMAAADVGALHRRERWFCVAYASEFGGRRDNGHEQGRQSVGEGYSAMGDTASIPDDLRYVQRCTVPPIATTGEAVAHAPDGRRQTSDTQERRLWEFDAGCQGRNDIPDANGEPMGRLAIAWAERGIGTAQPGMGRMSNGVPAGLDGHRWPARPGEQQYDWEPPRTVSKGEVSRRADRLKALGNAVVPQVVYPFAVAIRDFLSR